MTGQPETQELVEASHTTMYNDDSAEVTFERDKLAVQYHKSTN